MILDGLNQVDRPKNPVFPKTSHVNHELHDKLRPSPSSSSDEKNFNNNLQENFDLEIPAEQEVIKNPDPEIEYLRSKAIQMATTSQKKYVLIKGTLGAERQELIFEFICELFEKGEQLIVVTPTDTARDMLLNLVKAKLIERGMKISETTLLTADDYQHRMNNIIEGEAQKHIHDEKSFAQYRYMIWDLKKRAHEYIFKDTMVFFAAIADNFLEKSNQSTNFNPKIIIADEAHAIPANEFWPKAKGMKRIVMAGVPEPTKLLKNGRKATTSMNRLLKYDHKDLDVIHLDNENRLHKMENALRGFRIEAEPSNTSVVTLELAGFSNKSIKLVIGFGHPNGEDFTINFKNDSGKKSIIYDLVNVSRTHELAPSADLNELAFKEFQSLLHIYYHNVNRIYFNGSFFDTGFADYNLDIENLPNLRKLYVCNTLEKFNLKLQESLLIRHVTYLVRGHQFGLKYEHFSELSASVVEIHIGDITPDNIFHFCNLYKNGKTRKNLAVCKFNLQDSHFSLQKLLNLLNPEVIVVEAENVQNFNLWDNTGKKIGFRIQKGIELEMKFKREAQ